jgi:RND family efflux transporter MFP subunit
MISINKRILTALTLIILLSGCGKDSDNDSTNHADAAIPVHTVMVTEEEVTPVLDYSGTVEPWAEAALGSEIPGRIETLHCDVGDTVQAGFLIAEMGSETLIQVRANFDATEKDWNRIKSLREVGTVSQQTYDRTQAAFDAAKATYEKTLASTQLRAPFSGVITQKYLDEGEVFTLFPGPAGSPAIVRLMLLDTVKVVISVSETEYTEISKGQEALLVLDAYPNMEFVGEVSLIAPTLDTRSRTADVEVKFSNQDGKIRPGMFGLIKLSLTPRELLLVNREVLIRQEGTGISFVYRVENEVAVRQDITVGGKYGEQVHIRKGLQAGDQVITTGKMLVGSGAQVEVKSSEVSR